MTIDVRSSARYRQLFPWAHKTHPYQRAESAKSTRLEV
jgi:hypothetical protein